MHRVLCMPVHHPAALPLSQGAQVRAGGVPEVPTMVHTSPAATPSGTRGQAGAEVGDNGYGGRHTWLWMPEKWKSSNVQKREENSNQAMGTQACEGERQPERARPKRTAKGAK